MPRVTNFLENFYNGYASLSISENSIFLNRSFTWNGKQVQFGKAG